MACFVGIAQCERGMEHDKEVGPRVSPLDGLELTGSVGSFQALLWLEEVQILYLNARITRQGKLYGIYAVSLNQLLQRILVRRLGRLVPRQSRHLRTIRPCQCSRLRYIPLARKHGFGRP